MDKKKEIKYEAIDKFLKELYEKGKSEVVCPFCHTPLKIEGDITASYEVKCQTEGCLKSTFRGI